MPKDFCSDIAAYILYDEKSELNIITDVADGNFCERDFHLSRPAAS